MSGGLMKQEQAQKLTASDRAYRKIVTLIRSGDLGPGVAVKVRDIAGMLGSSTTPVREAISRLIHEGLLGFEPNKGAWVRDISHQTIAEILQVRAALEGLAAREACGKLTDEQLDQLADLAGEIELMQETGRTDESDVQEEQFHGLILEAAGNAYLNRLVEGGQLILQCSQIQRVVDLIRNVRPVGAPTARPNHFDLIAALRDGDPDRAETTARKHILVGRAQLLQAAAEARRILAGRSGARLVGAAGMGRR